MCRMKSDKGLVVSCPKSAKRVVRELFVIFMVCGRLLAKISLDASQIVPYFPTSCYTSPLVMMSSIPQAIWSALKSATSNSSKDIHDLTIELMRVKQQVEKLDRKHTTRSDILEPHR